MHVYVSGSPDHDETAGESTRLCIVMVGTCVSGCDHCDLIVLELPPASIQWHGACNMVHGTWSIEQGAWCKERGARSVANGT